MTTFNWPAAIGILVTAPLIGRFLDAICYKIYLPSIKNWFFEKAINFDEASLKQLVHQDIKKAHGKLERMFGSGWISYRMIGISIGPPLVIIGLVEMANFESIEHWEFSLFGFFLGTVLCMLNLVTDQISLVFTRQILTRVKPLVSSIALWGIADLSLITVLGPLPLFGTSLIAIYPETNIVTVGKAIFESLNFNLKSFKEIMNLLNFSTELLFSLLSVVFSLISQINFFDLQTGGPLFFVIFTAAIPSTIHISLVMKDLIRVFILRPFCIACSNFCEYISDERSPMTWLCGTLGMIPMVVKGWSELSF